MKLNQIADKPGSRCMARPSTLSSLDSLGSWLARDRPLGVARDRPAREHHDDGDSEGQRLARIPRSFRRGLGLAFFILRGPGFRQCSSMR